MSAPAGTVLRHDAAAPATPERAFDWHTIATEAKLLLIGIPVFIWTLLPIYHMVLFAISPKQEAFSGKLWPTTRPCAISRSCSGRSTTS